MLKRLILADFSDLRPHLLLDCVSVTFINNPVALKWLFRPVINFHVESQPVT